MDASRDSAAPNEGDATPEPPWGLGRRVAFRFAALYVFLWLAPWPLPTELLEKALGVKISGLLSDALVTWVGMDVLGIAGTYEAWSASGDTAYRWVFHLIIVVLAGIGAMAWSVVARRRSHHHSGYIWLVVYLRFYLAGQMLGYGLSKVAGHQFGDGGHTVARLYTALGDLTPTQLLWEFMGHSWVYSGFTGLAEVVGGALLSATSSSSTCSTTSL